MKLEYDIAPYMETLFEIYKEIDAAYEESARHYGFSCEGCDENCCTTVFYHHTILEFFGLLEGFDMLPQDLQQESLQRAGEYLKELNRYRGREEQVKMLCPLNYDGLCKIYEHRPLICRIHGLPGELEYPGKGKQAFSACKRFNALEMGDETVVIDRTPFYTRIATLEGQIRGEMQYMTKFRKTIAEMLIDKNL